MPERMHAGEVDIDSALVRQLVDSQFPDLRGIDVRHCRTMGTVNAIYRLGADLCARLPRRGDWVGSLTNELDWLDRLRPHLPLRIPEPVAVGSPAFGYPFPWAIYRWLDGDDWTADSVDDGARSAEDLASFISALRRVDTTGAPESGRAPLSELDDVTRRSIAATAGLDTVGVTAAWERSVDAPVWDGHPVWRHCDLLPPNLLLREGRIWAVLDFGGAGIGDPAADVVAAWSVLRPGSRATFRELLGVDDATWARARGYALHQALLIIPYYAASNPEFVGVARETVRQVLGDMDLGAGR
jgi:aminoglycoside phosphotransferase (APT) family kinase protein